MAQQRKDILNNLRALLQGTRAPVSTEQSDQSRKKRKAENEEAETDLKRPRKIHRSQKEESRPSKDLTGEGPAPSRTDGGAKATGLANTTKKKREASDTEAEAGAGRPAKVARQSPPPSASLGVEEAEAGRPAKVARQSPPPPTSLGVDEAEQREPRDDTYDWWQLAIIPKSGEIKDLDVKYEQRSLLGDGGFSSVYSGVRRSDQLPVAMKLIPRTEVVFSSGMWFNGEEVTFPTEVILMCNAGSGPRAIGCDPSVALLDWYSLAEGLVLVMERPTPSQDLRRFCEEHGPLSEEFAKELTLQLVRAVSDLHKKKVFHRDLKLENILIQLTETGPRVRIIDFGCGCQVRSAPYSSFSGTENIMPPELITGGQYCAGPASVWQIGCTLVDMLNLAGLRFSTRDFLRGVEELPEGLSQGCQDFIRDCLTLKPELRPALETLALHPWLNQ